MSLASNQEYNLNITVANLFNQPLAAVVEQTIPTNATVVSAPGGALQNFSLAWTNVLMPFTRQTFNIIFSYPASPGTVFTLPAASLIFTDPVSGATLQTEGNVPQITSQSPVEAFGAIPMGLQGVPTQVTLTISNTVSASEQGTAVLLVINNDGATAFSVTNEFSIGALSSTVLTATLPNTLGSGSYSVEWELVLNGGSTVAFAGIYNNESTSINIQNYNGNLSLSWNSPGILQSANSPAGPFADDTNASPPFVVAATNAWQFYRVRFPVQ